MLNICDGPGCIPPLVRWLLEFGSSWIDEWYWVYNTFSIIKYLLWSDKFLQNMIKSSTYTIYLWTPVCCLYFLLLGLALCTFVEAQPELKGSFGCYSYFPTVEGSKMLPIWRLILPCHVGRRCVQRNQICRYPLSVVKAGCSQSWSLFLGAHRNALDFEFCPKYQ